MNAQPPIVELSRGKFVLGCAVAALALLAWGSVRPLPLWLLGAEVFATILGLFVLGSGRYRLHKDALTYGMLLVVAATFWGVWWRGSAMRERVAAEGWGPFWRTLAHYGFTLEGLDAIVHADTMLFILGLTFFVAVISQTKLLETISFALLRRNRGAVLPTVLAITALVSFASGILDGVSMIGLTIRILVIILSLAGAARGDVIYAVTVSTVVTTVCGMWLAYGEPPNLIMKANLEPHLDDAFFLRYCAPLAIASFGVVAVSLRLRLSGRRVPLDALPQTTVDAELRRAQLIGALAFIPFVGLLVWHALDHHVRLFWSSFAGFAVAFLGIAARSHLRGHALREGRNEFAEYYFLFPLFLSITLLQTAGFFDSLQGMLHAGIDTIGTSHVAFIQFASATFLSAILDNNVVADFAARALIGLRLDWLHFFAMAQIAGYALGGCWTHIGCAQSVVAYAFIQREVDASFTPFEWIRLMTPVLTALFVLLTAFVYAEGLFVGR